MKTKQLGFVAIMTLCALLFVVSAQAQNDTTRVLFIGNSHTYYNNLPGMFALLAGSGGFPVVSDSNTIGGYALEGHRTNAVTLQKISQGGWNYVILQENSVYPVIDFYRYGSMYPSAVFLDSLIRAHNGHTALFLTWGWRGGGQRSLNGHYSVPFVDYFQMQDTMTAAYEMLNSMLSSTLVPAGRAWARAMRTDTTLDLWQVADNYHPNLKGSYLAACVFYAVFFHRSPRGLSYIAGLQPDTAAFLQLMADQTVGVDERNPDQVPLTFEMVSYPNPFNSSTMISIADTDKADIDIFDIAGRRVTTLHATGGRAVWNAAGFPSGLYFARTEGKNISKSIKLTLLK